MKFLHLLEFELKRFFPYGATLMLGTFLFQIIYYYFDFQKKLTDYQNHIVKYKDIQFFYENNGVSIWEVAPIIIGITIIGLYIAMIWYRDWKETHLFIARLLMLPIHRMQIYFVKLLTILMYTWSLVFTQLFTLWFVFQMYQKILPAPLHYTHSFESFLVFYPFNFIFPNQWIDFVLIYGLGIAFVILIFTCILFERAFQWKGLATGIVLFFSCVALCLLPNILHSVLLSYEIIILTILTCIFCTVVNLFLSRYLLKNKITI